MSINDLDITTTLRDLSDLIRTEADPRRRAALYETFLQVASDIARDGFEGAMYALRASGVTVDEIADERGVAPWTVSRWTNAYAARHGVKRLGRPPRVSGAVRIQTLNRG